MSSGSFGLGFSEMSFFMPTPTTQTADRVIFVQRAFKSKHSSNISAAEVTKKKNKHKICDAYQ